MALSTVTHLNFCGEARAALAFYRSVFGGDVTLVTYANANSVENPAEADQVMWGQVVADNGFRVMAYDVPASRPFARGEGSFFVSLRGDDEDEIKSFWQGLSDGGTVLVELGPAQWAPLYGMVVDRFGIAWVLDIAAPWGG